ncbi:MATE family efflux transporter [Phnomibacter ginsenosidimutans]|uniref:MATE family efflux transporter n=1 Tax=Phnomibacter ginsenosidimutans TaxID=2676868 RepID=UPI001FE72809|nr:MATE family efflux transporter [Phnomibacter ginsenosidimutans]
MLVREFKQTLRLSIPLIVSNVAQVGLGLIDSAMVGSISYKQLAASSFVINAIGIPQVICIGMTIAITALVSIARGQNDTVAASSFLYNGVFLSTLVSIIIASICTIASPLLWHMGQEPEVVALAAPYFKVMIWSLVPMTFFLSMKQFSDALEMTRIGMFLSFMSLPLNALLNWLFIFGNLGLPRMELLGAGVGTLLTRVVEAIVMLYIIFNSKAFTKYVAVKKKLGKYNANVLLNCYTLAFPVACSW